MSDLVTINSKNKLEESSAPKLSRRRFLQGLGSGAAATTLAACTDNNEQKAYPNVRGDMNQVPGVAVWYRSTCTECSAGCSITARNREGRTVKIEGNPDSPINKGSLCALGQSSLQALYDPDRVRQPVLKQEEERVKSTGAKYNIQVFKPLSWKDSIKKVADGLKSGSGKSLLVTSELSGSLEELVKDFCEQLGVTHVVYDVTQPVGLAQASELVFGHYGVPDYRLEDADFVLNFGADFLETWVSAAELSRRWAKSRRKKVPTRYLHLEARLSNTAANADQYFSTTPGSEADVLRLLLRELAEGSKLPAALQSKIGKALKGLKYDAVAKSSGLSRERLSTIVSRLREAKSPLVLVGGTASMTTNSKSVAVLGNLLNLALGAVGKSVRLGRRRKPQSSIGALLSAIEELAPESDDSAKFGVVMFDSSNPVFTTPTSSRLAYAMKRAELRVSFSSFMDESTKACDICLPSSHSLESWGDAMPVEGVASIIQPTMKPVFDTQSFGDSLIAIAKAAGKTLKRSADNFEAYVKSRWQEIHAAHSTGASFDTWWLERVQQGGWFQEEAAEPGLKSPGAEVLDYLSDGAKFHSDSSTKNGLKLYPFLSVKGTDGREANRGWLQELPDPMTKVVWDSWVELHPDTASELGVKTKDIVTIRNRDGELNVPAYVSKYTRPGVLAVPVGQGHTDYGRFASSLKGRGNPFTMIELAGTSLDTLPLVSAMVTAKKSVSKPDMVITQGSDTQAKRPIVQTDYIDSKGKKVKKSYKYHDYHNAKDMYEQRKHPLYEWAMVVDQSVCTGCSACVVACYAENNISVVGREVSAQGREMSWLRLDRYFDGPDEQPVTGFQPMMCQQCNNAPCEPVCPVYATYHNEEGLNVMVYNRCVGTRYCANNCSYKVRRFNWYDYEFPTPLDWQLNPDVTKRTAGVMEKCTFCVQRINEAKDHAKDKGRLVNDGEVSPACVQTCPTQALVFGNLRDPNSAVSKLAGSDRAYKILDYHLNTQPSVIYLRNRRYKA